jgi:hypothetical protein
MANKNYSINDYFELYLANIISYDRIEHINNMKNVDFSHVNDHLIKKIFIYIDQVIFGGKLLKYTTDNNIILKFKVSKSMSSTAGFFFWKQYYLNGKPEKMIMGFKISKTFFQNIIDNNILNIDLGTLDKNNKKYLSKNTIEPLFHTMEHEIIHMLMYITKSHKMNDSDSVKSGHTKVFKKLVYNIFGHMVITHNLALGDMTINQEIKNSIQIGSWVKNIITQDEGIIVMIKNKSAIMCIKDTNKIKYLNVIYKDIKKLNKVENIKQMISRIIPNVWIEIDKKKFKVVRINNQSIVGMTSDNKLWKIPIYRILEIIIL